MIPDFSKNFKRQGAKVAFFTDFINNIALKTTAFRQPRSTKSVFRVEY